MSEALPQGDGELSRRGGTTNEEAAAEMGLMSAGNAERQETFVTNKALFVRTLE